MDIVAQLREALGTDLVASGDAIDEQRLHDWMVTAKAGDRPLAVVRPRTTSDVAEVLRLCHADRRPIVAQGGLTGLAGGATPVRDAVLLSLERMKAVEEVDAAALTMTVQAGSTLQAVQDAADAAGLLFPLDLGARGSCAIGGNASTNAGGNRVLRYGMTRDLVLGLEVVLADGTVITSLNKMLKNNAGYDLKQLFIGAEGTLGIITRLVLRLHPRPRSVCTALCALSDYTAVLRFLTLARDGLAGTLSAFEMMWPDFYAFALQERGIRAPLPQGEGAYLLIEAMGSDQSSDQARFEALISEGLTEGCVTDAVVAQSIKDAGALWSIRDMSGELRRGFWPHAGFDVSISVGQIGNFVGACTDRLRARWPSVRTIVWGHVADSNIHIAVKTGDDPLPTDDIDEIVYGAVRDWHGSISAEHGIGILKRPYLSYSRTEAEIELMHTIKRCLDPQGLLNPGKII